MRPATVESLKAALKAKGLKISGNKATLPKRLQDSEGVLRRSSRKRKLSSSSTPATPASPLPASNGRKGDSIAERNKRGRKAGKRAVRAAQGRGATLLNRGAGVMPTDGQAPFGGARYTLLEDADDATSPEQVGPHNGKRDARGKLVFPGEPMFRPLLSPAQMIRAGVFGGCYFNGKGGKPGIFGRVVDIDYKEFPAAWFKGVDPSMYRSRKYNIATNKYGVKSGKDQAFWEGKGWIHEQDPRGWFQWYCRYFEGRRTADDERQIKRWSRCAGKKGRWRNNLCGKVFRNSSTFDDFSVSPVVRQTLLHWAYELTEKDYNSWLKKAK